MFPEPALQELQQLLTSGKRILVTTHIRPDPDAIGSALAIREFFANAGCDPHVILEDECPPRCRFLPGASLIQLESASPPDETFDEVIIVDAGDRGRIGSVERLIVRDARIVNIDHHGSNNLFGTLNFVYADTSACGELLYKMFRALNREVTPSIAANLYAGVLTDTGRFRHSNTTAQSLRVAAELTEAGANATEITDRLYFTISADDVMSMGLILSTLELHADGKISTMLVTIEHGIEDPDHVVDFARAIDGVELAALLSEMRDGKIRVSLRSKSYVNVSDLAASFGGGGHIRAAGFRMHGSLESVKKRIMPALTEALSRNTVAT